MSLFLMDTDHLSLYELGHTPVVRQVVLHITDVITISVITVLEQLEGWQRALHQCKQDPQRERIYSHMAHTMASLSGWPVLPYTLPAMQRRKTFLHMRLNVGSNDLKIAASALEYQATILTRNRRDFSRIPGLAFKDWSV